MDPSSSTPTPHTTPVGTPPGHAAPPLPNNSSPNVHTVPGSSPAPIIPPLYIDNLAREFGLGDRDRMKLRGLVQVVTAFGGGLSLENVAAHLYTVAIILSEAAERRRLEQENTFTGDLRTMMRDLQIRLDEGFTLTVNQRVILTNKKEGLDLDNIFGVPVREKKLMATVRKGCSSVRNALRQEIRDSIDPAKFVTLDKFVYNLASKYKLGGVVGELSDTYNIHAVLLRRFAFDHPELLWTDEPVEDEDSESPPKKRKCPC
ncbi:hypothetical protein B0H14DRAFT_3868397 [Mycena olivaceomarginata]|nr:hypothetical protein B0H14DRAFT_3868397 [Mycena olivaceomarginata]